MNSPPHISKPILWFFRLIVRVWFGFHFTSVLTLDTEPFTSAADASPLIIYGNHSSWWDPMIAILLAAKLMPRRRHYAPIDEQSLNQNWILGKVGLFPVDIHSARGAKQFKQATASILSSYGVLWITPQGRFADTRETPLAFKSGLASAAWSAAPGVGCTVIPLATEYTFWNQRRPHALLHFGKPIHLATEAFKPALTQQFEQELQQAMDELKAQSLTRNPANFTELPLWSKAIR